MRTIEDDQNRQRHNALHYLGVFLSGSIAGVLVIFGALQLAERFTNTFVGVVTSVFTAPAFVATRIIGLLTCGNSCYSDTELSAYSMLPMVLLGIIVGAIIYGIIFTLLFHFYKKREGV